MTDGLAISLAPGAPTWSRAGATLSRWVLVVGALDLVENVALLLFLGGKPGPWVPLAGVVSSLKWLGLVVVVGYILSSGARLLCGC